MLFDANTRRPSFFADREGSFIIRLRVIDGDFVSDHDDVVIRVIANSKPIAILNADQSLQPGQLAILDASASFDLDNDDLTFRWAIDVAPPGSNSYLFAPSSATTQFIPDIPGLYLVRVFVSDSILVDEAYITIRAEGEIMFPPVANAGDDAFVATGETVMLSGLASTDSNDLTLTYNWQIERSVSGSQASIVNPTSATPSFTPDLDGEYILSLQVSNGDLTSTPDLIKITAQQKPIADIMARGFILGAGSVVILDASDSLSPHGDDLTYSWAFLERPTGSQAAFTQATDIITSFTADMVGTYRVSLTVQTEHLSSVVVEKNIIVAGQKEMTLVAGSIINLDGGSYGNPNLNWEVVSHPIGSRARILKGQNIMARSDTDIEGSYVVKWVFREGNLQYNDYSIIHAYWPQGTVVLAHSL